MTDTALNTEGHVAPLVAKNLWEAVYQSVGAASVCWENMSGTGVFQESDARDVAENLIEWVRARLDPDTLALIFKAAWHAADRSGLEGRRTDAGIAAVINWVLGDSDEDSDQIALFEPPC